MNTHELAGADLDLAVAVAEGLQVEGRYPNGDIWLLGHSVDRDYMPIPFTPSRDWSVGGPLIQKHGLSINKIGDLWFAGPDSRTENGCAHSVLVAAMRAIVQAKYGSKIPPEKILWR